MTEQTTEVNSVPVGIQDLETFKRAINGMIVKSDRSWTDISDRFLRRQRLKNYDEKEVEDIINSGSLLAQQRLSMNYFLKDSLYKRIIIYYATLLKYVGILIPNPSAGIELSTPYVTKRYNNALDYIDKMFIPDMLTRFSLRALIYGCYYGVLRDVSKTNFALLDLPVEYCRSDFKDFYGNDIIEFNVQYFDSIYDESSRKQALKVYPKIVSDHYNRYKKGQVKTYWVKIPTDIGFCFSFFDDNRPLFLDLIPAAIAYDDAVDINRERDLEEIRKIIVQKIPHLADGMLLFEPQEAEVMHSGAVEMMKGNKNISVLTTYADVDAIVSKASSEATTNSLEKSLQNFYSKANASMQIFSPTGSQALGTSILNDMSMMMILAHKYGKFLSYIINNLFANSNITFKYEILPITWYNEKEYITNTLKMATNGYSYILPAIAAGLSQKDLVNVKKLENTLLKLQDLLIPLNNSFTQGTGNVGRPKLSVDEKSPKTLQNEESLDKQ